MNHAVDRPPFFIVLNAASGSSDAAATRDVIEGVLSEAGRAHDLRVVENPAELAETARAVVAQAVARRGVVVVAGGDGTINTVAHAAHRARCPLGVLPQGTFNYFSREHGISADTEEATRALLVARPHPVQVGLVNDRLFLVSASLGLYPQLIEDREAAKRQFGRSRGVALFAAFGTLLREPRQLTLGIEVDGRHRAMRTPLLLVINNALQLEQIGLPEAAVLSHDRLVALAPRPVGSWALLGLALRGALGRLVDDRNLTSFEFACIKVHPGSRATRRGVKVAIDGEIVRLVAPIEFKVAPDPLYLLKPDTVPNPQRPRVTPP